MTLNRRKFLKAGAVAAPAALAAPAYAQGKRKLQMVMSWPHNFPGLASIAYNFAEFVDKMTDGDLTVDVAAAGELVAAFEVYDAVGSGAADCMHSTPAYITGQWQPAVFFSQIPFGLTQVEHMAWMNHGGGQELQHEAFREIFGVVPFTCGQTGIQMAGWFNKEINNIEDLRGITMRMPGLGGEVMRRVGANAVLIPAQEIFPALQSGALDGTELQGPWLDTVSGFYQHAKYYYAPGFQEPNSAGEIAINANVFDELSPSHQAIVQHAIQSANSINVGEWAYNNAQFYQTLKNEHGVEVREYPQDVIDELAKMSAEAVAELGEVDDRARAIYASYSDYLKKAVEYSVAAEVPYYRARVRQVEVSKG
ncbi:TRAP transporter substrate-binding protein [Ruegeria sp. WL0004]|uniref:TRAP transporter substrate-binding protein n=1 Tax=Ruegeria marisflavi TaxID=2984152 RepID=A0ABT2WWM0_9RHOB|nr:TRAP transporter substrate-binding protein [Ruegeria sp. WL0004]MCU9840286.1 TRAP transporter substrate-binding protein [Ruegeria sp. WL0004]